MQELKNRKVLIVGFGKSGQAAARYCLSRGAHVTVTDSRPEKDINPCSQALKYLNTATSKNVIPTEVGIHETSKTLDSGFRRNDKCEVFRSAHTYFGSHPDHIFAETDLVVVSPGVPLTLKGIGLARSRGVPVVGEMELVEIPAKIIAITGTNGKSTVTTLVGEILKEAGKKAAVGGNLGTPLLDMLDEIKSSEFVVLEVSSYQLEISPSFHPHIAALLNITPDHLDRYASYDEYIRAKALIVKNLAQGDFFIFNRGDSLVRKIALLSAAKNIEFDGAVKLAGLNFDKAKIYGSHNRENMIAAALTAMAAGCGLDAAQRVFERFEGLPHRNRFVVEVNGVKFYDDSKGTNVGAVVKSLEGFDSKVILIAGGLDKGGSYEPLRKPVIEKVKGMVLIGEAKEKIAAAFHGLTKIVFAEDMRAAVREAAAMASKGDAVLLSPACASFDMFKDYAHRGDEFIKAVRGL